jgi:hypothetical protein
MRELSTLAEMAAWAGDPKLKERRTTRRVELREGKVVHLGMAQL